MTKEQLSEFNGRPIRFTVGGLPFVGVLHHDGWRHAFKIIYPVVDDGKGRNEAFPLHDALIERIVFDHDQNLLALG
jgi:hypothetical protein